MRTARRGREAPLPPDELDAIAERMRQENRTTFRKQAAARRAWFEKKGRTTWKASEARHS
jgi:hypothetical protein